MVYKINGTQIQQPTSGKWQKSDDLGISGEGRTVYAPKREFELRWNLIPISDFQAIRGFWVGDSATGSVAVDLPDIEDSSYAFRTFSGCHLDEPSVGQYFQEHLENVVLVVRNIST